jgi:DNA-binding CsgD family transcriptional regulator/tetratricopeptide (TPR) repeat protein
LSRDDGPPLWGRRTECEALDRLITAVLAGHSQALVLRGEAGVGKTALLDYLTDSGPQCRVARAAGVESEMELPFAGLHQLCAPMLDRLSRLPGPQADALATAFGLSSGESPDRFLVGLAALTLLSDLADEQPLLCVIDDAQWLDRASAQALAFVGRRLRQEAVALVFAEREASGELAGLPELAVGGLGDADARALLESVVAGPLDARVRDRIVAETNGNPLALMELPHGLTHAELAGGFGLSAGLALSGQIEESFQRRLSRLPPTSRELLLIAAAEPLGDPVTVWHAAELLGVGAQAAGPASGAGLIEFGGRIRFRHPLVRSAVYRSSSLADRLRAHRALAEATDPGADPDRRAWHLAQATPALDEQVAAQLEESAGRAQARGGLAAAAAFLGRAADLTPNPEPRARRALAAAQCSHEAGAPDAALELLAMAEAGPLEELQRARAELLRAQIRFAVDRGRDAPPLLLAAAKRLETLDPRLSRETYLDAFSAALFAGRLALDGGVREVAEAVLAADWGESVAELPRACDLLLEGVAVLTTRGYAAGAPELKRALSAFRDEPMSDEDALRWLWLACRVARALGDDASWDELTLRQVRLARERGALSVLPIALIERFSVQLFVGDLGAAQALVTEAEAVIEASGSHLAPQGAIALAAWRGSEQEVSRLIDAGRDEVERRGEGLWLIATEWASAVLFNSLGRYEEALAVSERAGEDSGELGVSTWVPTEFIEAAVRAGQPERAAPPLRRLQQISRASGSDWTLGVEARSRALLSEDEEAERLYREAIDRLGRTRVKIALARAQLLYGEWLRRQGRRVEAREQLRTAYGTYAAVGMEGFAERARRELAASGEKVRTRTVDTRDDLTAQEAQIGRLAADGRTNPEIGAQLFISPRTVEWHLHKVYAKLGISSRRELQSALPEPGR